MSTFGGVKQTLGQAPEMTLMTDSVEKVASLKSLQIRQNANDIFDLR